MNCCSKESKEEKECHEGSGNQSGDGKKWIQWVAVGLILLMVIGFILR